jgi:uncharacterized protein (DUF1330 family)
MKKNHKLALAMLAGVSIGIAGAMAIHPQQIRTPPTYVVAELEVTDPATYQKYSAQVPETLAPFHGHFIVRGGKIETVEGAPPQRLVVIAFDSLEKARAWYDSSVYKAILPLRLSSAKTRLFIVEGVVPQ